MKDSHGSTSRKRTATDVYLASSSAPVDDANCLPFLSAKRLSLLTERSRLRSPHVGTSSLVPASSQSSAQSFVSSVSYLDIGDCTEVYEYCNACFWYEERLKSYSPRRRPQYNQCCKTGRVRLQHPKEPPNAVKRLFENSEFLDNIRAYNSMFAMTSFGATLGESINVGSGPYVFKGSGQICHRIGSFCPPPNEPPRFLQMYIYDTEHEISNRLSIFGQNVPSCLNIEIVKILLETLDHINELVKLFRTARDLCISSNVPDFAIRLHNTAVERNSDSGPARTVDDRSFSKMEITASFWSDGWGTLVLFGEDSRNESILGFVFRSPGDGGRHT